MASPRASVLLALLIVSAMYGENPCKSRYKLLEIFCTRYVLNPFVTSGYNRLYQRDSGCSEGHSGSGLKCDLESLINSPSLKTRRDP
jgi:hypothetical protein